MPPSATLTRIFSREGHVGLGKLLHDSVNNVPNENMCYNFIHALPNPDGTDWPQKYIEFRGMIATFEASDIAEWTTLCARLLSMRWRI